MATITPWIPLVLAMAGQFADDPEPAISPPNSLGGVVVVESVSVFTTPDDRGFALAQLREGARVRIRAEGPPGWLRIAPPPGSFCWIDAANVDESGPEAVVVAADEATIRVGRQDARMPGPPRLALTRGTTLRRLDRAPLVLRQGPSTRSWLAVAAPDTLPCFLNADAIEPETDESLPGPGAGSQDAAPPPLPAAPRIDARLTSVGPPFEPSQVTPEIAAALRQVEAEHRAVLRQPLDRWKFQRVRGLYQRVAESTTDGTARGIARGRLDQIQRQQAAADSARRVQALLAQGEPNIALGVTALEGTPRNRKGPASPLAYDARGMLQPSTRMVEGRPVYSLIGDEGTAVAYLRFPPGLDATDCLGRDVGVRGPTHYDADLRARVVNVQELEPLGPAP
jgi:hypothetical protein